MTYSPERAKDMQYALFLAYHIRDPCSDPGTGVNIRSFYLREAQKALPTFDVPAQEFLKGIICEYDQHDQQS